MTTSLDSILSGQSESAPETTTTETAQAAQTEATGTEKGPETTEGQTQGEGAGEGGKTVPIEALHAERQKAKRYTEQVASFEQTLKDRDAAWERRFGQMLERITPQQQNPPDVPDFYADPQGSVNGALNAAITPVMQQIAQMSESVSRRFAVSEHGGDVVNAAYAEIERRLASDPAAPGEYQRIMRSGDPWGELVKWHKRESVMAEIGADPAAYREKMKAELLAELKGSQGGAAETPQAPSVMPSNMAAARNVGARSGPAWAGPTPLANIFKR